MSAVASLDLCRKLYELSGWEATSMKWVGWTAEEMDSPTDFNWRPTHHEQQGFYSMSGRVEDQLKAEDRVFPAYDLGYLLRKLPAYIGFNDEIVKLTIDRQSEKVCRASYAYPLERMKAKRRYADWKFTATQAPTPENAATKLAIELFKQGVLMREPES